MSPLPGIKNSLTHNTAILRKEPRVDFDSPFLAPSLVGCCFT